MQGLQGIGQGIGAVGQQQQLGNFKVSVTSPASQQRELTAQAIQDNIRRAQEEGSNVYWQVAIPQRFLRLTPQSGVNYVRRKYTNAVGTGKFVYLPQYRVAGTAQDISDRFTRAGINITPEQVLNSSLDPMNPQHAALIEQQAAGATSSGGRAPRFSLDEYIAFGTALKEQRTGTTTTAGRGGRGAAAGAGGRGGRGGRSPETARQNLINEFNQLMQSAVSGQPTERIFEVGKFNPERFSGIRRVAPPSTDQARSIRPTVNFNGRQIRLPFMAQPTDAAGLQAFVQSVVANSNWGQLAGPILQSFQQSQLQAQARPQLGAIQPLGTGAMASLAPLAPLQQTNVGLGAPSGMGIMQQLAQGAASPGGAMTPSSGGASPAGATIGGGFQLPTLGGGPSVSLGGASAGTTSLGALPSVGTARVGGGIPTAGGGFRLPTVGGGVGGLPGVQLPPMGSTSQ